MLTLDDLLEVAAAIRAGIAREPMMTVRSQKFFRLSDVLIEAAAAARRQALAEVCAAIDRRLATPEEEP